MVSIKYKTIDKVWECEASLVNKFLKILPIKFTFVCKVTVPKKTQTIKLQG